MSREMKDSGIEWIGKIPKEWKVKRLKYSCKLYGRIGFRGYSVDDLVEKGEGAITISPSNINGIDLDFSKCSYLSWVKYEESPEIMVHVSDVLLVKTASVGKCAYVSSMPMECTVNPQILVLKEHKDCPKYIAYIFQTQLGQAYIDVTKGGTTIPTISQEKIGNYSFPFPPFSEQQKIADYLDKVCGEIDEMIALQEKMIEELKAYKQSVITEAVTKGLNPNVAMRDSGIDWIGDIPEHWGTPALSFLASITSGSTPDRNNPLFWKNGTINWVKTGELHNERIYYSEEKVTEYALNNTSLKLYPINTILIAMYGQGKTRGTTALLAVPCTTNQACAAISICNDSIDTLFLWKCLIGAYDAIRQNAVGTGQPNLNVQMISKFIIPLPPLAEQTKIVEYINEIVPKIDSLIAIKQKKIEEFKDYKKSIIYEYVTGKKQVN